MLINEELHYLMILFFSFLLYIVIPFITIPLGYVGGENLILNKMSKIYNVNFSSNLFHLVDLLLGYLIGSFFIAYAIKDIFDVFFINMPHYNPLDSQLNLDAVAFSSVMFCYASRIISKRHGYLRGKQLFSYLSSIAILMYFINTSVRIYVDRNTSGSITLLKLFTDFYGVLINSYVSNTTEILEYFSKIKLLILIGSLVTASIGELFILFLKSHFRTIPIAQEKLPHDFELIITDKLPDAMKTLLENSTIKSLKITSRSLITCEILYENIKKLTKRNDLIEIIIIAPEFNIPCAEFGVKKTTLHSDISNKKKKMKYKLYLEEGEELKKRYMKLDELVANKRVRWIKEDINDFRMILVNNNKILLIVDAGDDTDTKIGLYSEEPYVVETWKKLFDSMCTSQ
jgi:hypothetical protein